MVNRVGSILLPFSLSLYIIDADEKRVFLVGPIGAISGCISGEADW